MPSSAIRTFAFLLVSFSSSLFFGQTNPQQLDTAPKPAASASTSTSTSPIVEALIPLRATSTKNLASEIGGAFMPPVKCDADGNLYIRRFAMNRSLGAVIKIDSDGKAAGLFDPAVFASLALTRVDAFSPASDGGIYQIAQSGIFKPRIYVLHYSSDGSASSPSRLDADFEVYTFAAFPDGNFLVSGVQRDPMDKNDHGRGATKVFSADGRELAQLTFQEPMQKAPKQKSPKPASLGAASGAKSGANTTNAQVQQAAPTEVVPLQPHKAADKLAGALDLKDAEISRDGSLYVMRTSSQALIDVIAPGGKITKTLKIASPLSSGGPVSFHVSENRIAVLFGNGDEQTAIALVDAQTGRKIASYSNTADLGSFACYSANDGVFTFLKHGDGNVIDMIRAEAQ